MDSVGKRNLNGAIQMVLFLGIFLITIIYGQFMSYLDR
jgi:hypothetical protein